METPRRPALRFLDRLLRTAASRMPALACFLAVAAGTPAQAGYVKAIPPGWSLVANQCANGSTVATLMPAVPFGTLLLKFNNGAGSFAPINAFSTSWSNPSQTLAPGEGAWIYNPTGVPFNITIPGTPNTPSLPLPYCSCPGCYLVSRQTAAAGDYANIMGCAPQDGSTVYKFDPATQTFLVATFTLGAWDPAELTAAVGEALWICPSGGPPPAVPALCSYTITVPAGGYQLIANQCANASTVASLMPSAPFGTLLLKYNNAGGTFAPVNAFSSGWSDPSQTLNPGEGAWICNPSASPITLLIVGAANTPSLPLPYCSGTSCYLVSRQTAAVGNYANIMGCAPQDGSIVYKFDPATQTFLVATFAFGAWDPVELTAAVGESLWVCPSGGPAPSVPTLCSYTISVSPGYQLIANQCANANTVASLMPSVPPGTLLLKYNNASGTFAPFNVFSSGWSDPSQTLAPGEGAWIYNPTATPFSILIAGTANTPSLPLPFCSGTSCYLVSRQTAAVGDYANIMGCAPQDGSTVYKFDPATQTFLVAAYAFGAWDPVELTAAVGESLWICPSGGPAPAVPALCSYGITVPAGGYQLIANQCANANTVASLIPSPPIGTKLFKYDNASASFEPANRFLGAGWTIPFQTLAPGQGAWIYNPSTTPFSIAIAGTANTPSLPLPYCSGTGCYLVSRQTAAVGNYANIMGCAPQDGSILYKFDPATQTFLVATYAFGAWDPVELTVSVGQSVWICPTGGPAPAAPCCLSISPNCINNMVTISWPCTGCGLEQTSALANPVSATVWTPVTGTSPVTVPVTGPAQFFRVVCP